MIIHLLILLDKYGLLYSKLFYRLAILLSYLNGKYDRDLRIIKNKKIGMNKNSSILITGGTGSFGKQMTARLLKRKIKEIRIFSRDEKKQDDMRKEFSDSKIKFYLGDIRDTSSVRKWLKMWIIYSMQLPSNRYHLANFIQWKQ